MNKSLGGLRFHLVLDTQELFEKNKIPGDFLNLIQYFFSILGFLKLILDT